MKYFFDHFSLDCDLAQLSVNGEPLAVEPRVFDLLVLLIENRQKVVSKEDIIESLWSGRFTSDAAISTCVKSLRKALQDDGDKQNFIKTVRGKGFRFIGELKPEQSAAINSTDKSASVNTEKLIQSPQLEQIVAASSLQGKPSIIVLPLQALGLDRHASVVAEALAHELIQALSRLRWLRVIARGTAFQFQQAQLNLPALAQQLHLRYALCGAIQSVGTHFAVTIELNDCISEDVVWAERFEMNLAQVHELRQAILANVISSLEMYIPLHEASLASLQTSDNMDAWANYHLGLRHMFRFNQADNIRAAHHFDQAILQDPSFARAYAGRSFTRFQDGFLNYTGDRDAAQQDARSFAEKAVELDPLDPFTNYNLGRSFWLQGNFIGGLGWLERSVSLSPNFAQGYYSCSFTEVMQGNPERALDNSSQALNLSPLDPLSYAMMSVRALACLRIDDMAQAVVWAEKSARSPNAHYLIKMIAAAILALADDQPRAQYWAQQVRLLNSDACLNSFFNAFPIAGDFREKITRGLKMVGFK